MLTEVPVYETGPRITVSRIQGVVAAYYALSKEELISSSRARRIARPRQVAIWICKQYTTRSLPDLGRRFGSRDHTTVLHTVRRIEALRVEDPKLAHDLREMMSRLYEPPPPVLS